MKFDTAIFYDIENLLKGCGFGQRIGLSLKDIFRQIQSTEELGKVAIQRAYANWSDLRLGFMKNELLELGIEPIQVFGFSFGGNKNVADIQLAVEVMDLVHSHPTLEKFVIVSGDGGYASLARKLHEYGKTIIGCAYKKTTNKVFEAVCDYFVWIDDPEYSEDNIANFKFTDNNFIPPSEVKTPYKDRKLREYSLLNPANTFYADTQVSDPRLQRLLMKIQRIKATENQETILNKVKEIINCIAEDNEFRLDLQVSGCSPSLFKDAINVSVIGFNPIKFGYGKFLEFLRFAVTDTPLGVWQSNVLSSDVKIGFRTKPIRHYTLMPELEPRNIHSIECYKSVLASGIPIFRLPDCNTLKNVAILLQQNPVSNMVFGEVLEQFVNLQEFQNGEDQENIKLALLCFVSADCFYKKPIIAKFSEQKLTLRDEYRSHEKIIEKLYIELQKKILYVLGDCKVEIFEEVIKE